MFLAEYILAFLATEKLILTCWLTAVITAYEMLFPAFITKTLTAMLAFLKM